MSEQNDTILRELEEATTESEPTSEGDATESTSDDSKQPTKELESLMSVTKTTQVDYAKQQEEAWAKKIAEDTTGEAYQNFKENKSLSWLHDRVESRLGVKTPAKSETFDEQMARYKAEEHKNTLMAKFQELPSDQRKEIKEKVREAVNGLGADPVKALSQAMSSVKEGSKPTPVIAGNRVSSNARVITMAQLSALPQHKYEEALAKKDRGELTITN